MTFIVKSDPQSLTAGQRVLISVKRYRSADPQAGDDVYFWHSETAKGSGLVAKGVVDAVSDENPVDLVITVTDAASGTRFGVAELKAHRDLSDGSPIAGLANTLYRQSHNKVAALSTDEAALLAHHWQARR